MTQYDECVVDHILRESNMKVDANIQDRELLRGCLL